MTRAKRAMGEVPGRRRRVALAGALGALVGVIVSAALVPSGDGQATLAFAVVPIGALGAVAGLAWGLAATAAACAALAGLALVAPSADVLGALGEAAAFLVAGGLVGAASIGRLGRFVGDSRWFEMSNDLLVEASLDGYFVRLTKRWEECLGWSREELMSRPFRDFIHPDDLVSTNVHADALDLAPGEVFNFENRYRHKDGSYRWLLWSARSDRHRKYAVARDITERKLLEQERLELLAQLEEAASTDALTRLPNRRAWDRELALAVTRARHEGRLLALAMVDLDEFKEYNDANGHAAGDALLAEAASAWRAVLRSGDFLARYGGEEFAILLPDCAPDEAAALLEAVRLATPSPQTCSVGIASLEHSESAEELSARADAALYQAKRAGRDRLVAADLPPRAAHRGIGGRIRRPEPRPAAR